MRLFSSSENSNQRADALNRNRLALDADFELEVGLGDGIDEDLRVARHRLEPGQFGGDLVDADWKFRQPEAALRVGDRRARETGFGADGSDVDAGKNASGPVSHRPGDVAGCSLREGDRGKGEYTDKPNHQRKSRTTWTIPPSDEVLQCKYRKVSPVVAFVPGVVNYRVTVHPQN